MPNSGLAYCTGFMATPFCITKLIQFLITSLLFIAIIYVFINRFLREREINFFLFISIQIIACIIFNMLFTLFHHIFVFYYLETLIFNIYFLTIIYQVALKLTKKSNLSKNYMITWTCIFIVFLLINVAIDIAYSIEMNKYYCNQVGYLIMDSLAIIFSILLIILGYNYYKIQHSKLTNLIGKQRKANQANYKNPLPYMSMWIGINIFCQLVSFAETLYFQISPLKCRFSENETINEIVKLILSIISFHLGILATIIFFKSKYTNMNNENKKDGRTSVRKDSIQENGVIQLFAIQTHKQQFL